MGEMKMYRDCLLPQLEKGKVTKIERQVEYVLQEGFERDHVKYKPITYIADFVVTFACGRTVVFDFKGMPDNLARVKRKLFMYRYPDIPFFWAVYSRIDGGYVCYETVQRNRKQRAKVRNMNKEIQ